MRRWLPRLRSCRRRRKHNHTNRDERYPCWARRLNLGSFRVHVSQAGARKANPVLDPGPGFQGPVAVEPSGILKKASPRYQAASILKTAIPPPAVLSRLTVQPKLPSSASVYILASLPDQRSVTL